jgi:hypothetical protein
MVVVLQEIFGVNRHIESVCQQLAQQGWLAVAQALFDRSQGEQALGYGPREHVQKITNVCPAAQIHLNPAGHGFNCEMRASFHEPSAKLAAERTREFLTAYLVN